MKGELSPQALATENQRLREALAAATARIQDLEHQVALFKRCLFGSRSEKVSAEELEARIAEHASEAREEGAQARRPVDPPPAAEEQQPEPPAAEGEGPPCTLRSKTSKRKEPARTVAVPCPRTCRDGALNTRSIRRRPSARTARIILPS
jgi:hypothetical protein